MSKTYVIRVPSGYLRSLRGVVGDRDILHVTSHVELAQVYPEMGSLGAWGIGEALNLARREWPPIEVWAIEVELRVVDGRPAFAIGADSGGGE